MSPATPEETEIAFLKRLAQAGRGQPAPFLMLMAVFGGAYGFILLAFLIAFAVEGWPDPRAGDYQVGPVVLFLNQWGIIAAHLAFLAALLWTGWRLLQPGRPRLNRAASAAWTAAFIGLVTIFIAMRLFTRNAAPSDSVHSVHLMGPILLVLWGAAWWVTALTSERPWLLAVAFGSFAAALALAWVGASMMQMPLICACLLLLAFLPAVILMWRGARDRTSS